jgi:hypothetical protein
VAGVVTGASFDDGESPAALRAFTVYVYMEDATTLVSCQLVVPAGRSGDTWTTAIAAPSLRKTWYEVSLLALSVQVRPTAVDDWATAVRPVGAAGAVRAAGVVTDDDAGDSSDTSSSLTA